MREGRLEAPEDAKEDPEEANDESDGTDAGVVKKSRSLRAAAEAGSWGGVGGGDGACGASAWVASTTATAAVCVSASQVVIVGREIAGTRTARTGAAGVAVCVATSAEETRAAPTGDGRLEGTTGWRGDATPCGRGDLPGVDSLRTLSLACASFSALSARTCASARSLADFSC